jgi:hypothetical protein
MTSNNSASNGLKLQKNEGVKKFVINAMPTFRVILPENRPPWQNMIVISQ